MLPIRDFVCNLAVGGHTTSEILSEVERTFRIGAMSKSLSSHNPKKTVRTPEVIASVKALITSDRGITEAEIKEETGLSYVTVHKILSEDLRLVKKTAHWLPRLLTK